MTGNRVIYTGLEIDCFLVSVFVSGHTTFTDRVVNTGSVTQ